MLRILVGMFRVLSLVFLKKIDMLEEERLFIMRIYDYEGEVFKK